MVGGRWSNGRHCGTRCFEGSRSFLDPTLPFLLFVGSWIKPTIVNRLSRKKISTTTPQNWHFLVNNPPHHPPFIHPISSSFHLTYPSSDFSDHPHSLTFPRFQKPLFSPTLPIPFALPFLHSPPSSSPPHHPRSCLPIHFLATRPAETGASALVFPRAVSFSVDHAGVMPQ